MKTLRRILTICVVLGIAYLAVYAVQDWMTRNSSEERSEAVQALRKEETPSPAPAMTEDAAEISVTAPAATETATSVPAATPEATESATEAPADEATASVTETPDAAETATAAPAATDSPAVTAVPAAEATQDPLLMYYHELYEQNTDMVGWIYVEGTVIDYPVMYTQEDKEYYLHKNFEKKYSFAGTPFVDARCELEPRCDNVIIYAHNMKNGTMFGQLSKYLESDFFEEYPFINYDTLTERGEYLIFAVVPVYMGKMDDERMRCYGVTMTQDENQVQQLYDYLDEYAVHVRKEALPAVGDDIVTLSTCTGYRDADRLVVMAVKIK